MAVGQSNQVLFMYYKITSLPPGTLFITASSVLRPSNQINTPKQKEKWKKTSGRATKERPYNTTIKAM